MTRLLEPFSRRKNHGLRIMRPLRGEWLDWGRRLMSLSEKLLRGFTKHSIMRPTKWKHFVLISIFPHSQLDLFKIVWDGSLVEDVHTASQSQETLFIYFYNCNVNRLLCPYVSLLPLVTMIFIYLPFLFDVPFVNDVIYLIFLTVFQLCYHVGSLLNFSS